MFATARASRLKAGREVTEVMVRTATLKPQVVGVPAPRLGLTLGRLLDIALAGTDKAESGSQEVRSNTAGFTAISSARAYCAIRTTLL